MTLAGIIIMVLSVTVVSGLFFWCVAKVLTVSDDQTDKLHGFEQETPDVEHDEK
ncbi:MAG: hypothetical protein MI748_10115 [Opitutales bacterium]|nr:hypothetical protein [Opitutales bacterium]